MSKPFDATSKALLEADPDAWLALAGLTPDGPLSPVDTDLSTVSAAADGVFRVDGPRPWLAHFEFQSSSDALLGSRLLKYNVLLVDHHGVPVQSILVLLRPRADGPDVSGDYQCRIGDDRPYLEFRYAVVRVWELSAAELLRGGLATLPLAPIANLESAPLGGVLATVEQRLRAEAPAAIAATYWTSTMVLMGLRYSREVAEALMRGGRYMDFMEDSWTYHWILDKGRAEGRAEGKAEAEIRILLKLGGKRFGAPSEPTAATIQAIADVPRLDALIDRLDDVASWDELLAAPPPDPG